MDSIGKSQNGSIIKSLTSITDAEEDEPMTRSQFIFYVSIRGVLLSAVMIFASFLNINTIVVIYKYRVLQITSNALIVCFSVGHSGLQCNLPLALWLCLTQEYTGMENKLCVICLSDNFPALSTIWFRSQPSALKEPTLFISHLTHSEPIVLVVW